VDNGSSDGTAELAAASGAQVVREATRGYRIACLRALATLPESTEILVFMPADLSEDPSEAARLIKPCAWCRAGSMAALLRKWSKPTTDYTYSKCLTNSIGYYGQGGQAATASAYFQNVYNAKAEYGPCDYDAAHNFVGNAVYSLPVGRDRKYGKTFNKALDAVVGGWQASGILSLHTGFPLTVNATDVSGTNARAARANSIAPGVVFGQQNAAQGGYQWFSPASYAQPASGTFGDCGVGTIRGPGLSTLDLNMSKNFAITEHQHVEVRAEFINLSNTPILNAPSRSVGSTLRLLQNSQGARNIQIALKYRF
jgi:glycosyltransferase involved in cell wall biosynthesis